MTARTFFIVIHYYNNNLSIYKSYDTANLNFTAAVDFEFKSDCDGI